MGVIWYKIWFDLWHNKTRTLLAVLSIAAGAFAVGAIFGMSELMISAMDSSHQSVLPPHIDVILTSNVDGTTLQNLSSVPGVAGIEPYNSVGVQYKLKPQDKWRQGIIHMRGDYQHQKYELVQLWEGHWPSNKGEIGVERMAAQYFGIGVGDSVTFKFGQQERTLPITSLIRHPFVPPLQIYDLAFFFADGQGLERFGVPDGTFNSFYARVTPYSPEHAREVASAIKDKLGRQDIGVANFSFQDPNRHWGRTYMDGFVLVQQLLAIICVIVSAILVYNTLSNLITQQTNQIGILKAIGGRSGTIVGVYLVSALVYGLLALIIAVPLGAIVAFVVTRFFLNLFNIPYDQFAISTHAVELQVLSALAAPLLAGLPPILHGAGITVRQAIASYGLAGGLGASWMDRAVERFGQRWLPSAYATALSNMVRRKGRLLLTELVLVTAGSSFLMVMSLNSSIALTMDRIYARSNYDSVILFNENQRVEHVRALLASFQGVDKSELHLMPSANLFVSGQLVKEAGVGASLEGIPAGSDIYKPLMVGGRWFLPGDGRAVVISRDTAEKNHIQIGDIVTLDLGELGKDQWQVIGLYDPVFVGGFSASTIYAPADALYEATKKFNQGSYLYILAKQHDAAYTSALTSEIKSVLDDRGLKVIQSQTKAEARTGNDFQFGMVVWMMMGLSVIVALVGGIALMGALSIGVIERTKEIGVLRAVGARSRTILGIFMMEGILQGLLSWLIALPVSLIASPLLARALGLAMFGATLDYSYNWQAVGMWFVFIIIISAIASIVPANRATHISVRDSLAYA